MLHKINTHKKIALALLAIALPATFACDDESPQLSKNDDKNDENAAKEFSQKFLGKIGRKHVRIYYLPDVILFDRAMIIGPRKGENENEYMKFQADRYIHKSKGLQPADDLDKDQKIQLDPKKQGGLFKKKKAKKTKKSKKNVKTGSLKTYERLVERKKLKGIIPWYILRFLPREIAKGNDAKKDLVRVNILQLSKDFKMTSGVADWQINRAYQAFQDKTSLLGTKTISNISHLTDKVGISEDLNDEDVTTNLDVGSSKDGKKGKGKTVIFMKYAFEPSRVGDARKRLGVVVTIFVALGISVPTGIKGYLKYRNEKAAKGENNDNKDDADDEKPARRRRKR